ncbi:MAG TPA: CPBP family intramembrane metalloprotease [Thermoanaerobaculia bacterium]|nr:CPBP family intramembrane metalloprotease [Thermoanaerobaculia bacterium]
MSTPIPYLDGLLLASAAYPSGFGHALFSTFTRGSAREVSRGFLVFLLLPYGAIALAVAALRPELLALRPTGWIWLIAALAVAPLALALEYGLAGLLAWKQGGRFPRRVALSGFWGAGLALPDHLLLAGIAAGEELVYRQLWPAALAGAFGWPAGLALGLSALAYGLNHLAFGGSAVLGKTLSGLAYGALYLAAGKSLWPPLLAHLAQNWSLFAVARGSRD